MSQFQGQKWFFYSGNEGAQIGRVAATLGIPLPPGETLMLVKSLPSTVRQIAIKGKNLFTFIGLLVALVALAACQEQIRTVEIEVTRNIEVTREVLVTMEVEVPVTREVEITREVPAAEQVEVTRVVELIKEVEVTRQIEVTREVEVPRTIEVTKEVPVTRVATATPPLNTPTPRPTPTPTIDLATTDKANLWVALYNAGYASPRIGASANPAFDVDVYDLDVIVRAGLVSETFFNVERIYSDDGYTELSQSLEANLSSVTGVSVQTPYGDLRCEHNESSTASELVYACSWRE